MQKILQLISITVIATTVLKTANAQTVSTFESLSLSPNSYWDGAASPGGATFTDGNAIFPNVYDSSFFLLDKRMGIFQYAGQHYSRFYKQLQRHYRFRG